MYRSIFSGMGDVLNPTAGTALDCGLFNFGVFRPECWCLSYPSLCSKSDYTAAYTLAHPEVIAPIQAPPAVGAPSGSELTVPPASGDVAQQTIDKLLAQQSADWKAQNAATIAQTQANLDKVEAQYDVLTASSGISGIPWYWWLAGGVGVFALVATGGGSSRRYGR